MCWFNVGPASQTDVILPDQLFRTGGRYGRSNLRSDRTPLCSTDPDH